MFNLPKFEICASELEFLGQVMDASGIRPSPKHTAAVRDYPAPWSKEENSRFLSLSSGHFCPMPPYCSSLAAYKPDEEKCSVLLGKGSTKIVEAADMTPTTTTTFKFSCFSQQMTHHLEALLIVDYDLLKVWLKLFLVDFQRGSSV